MAKTLPRPPRGYTFEDVWAALMENTEQLRKIQTEFDRQQKAMADRQQAEFDRQQAEFDRQQAEFDRQQAVFDKRQAEYEKQQKAARQAEAERLEKEAIEEAKRLEGIEIEKAKIEKLDRYMKRLGKQMGDLSRKFGKMAEHLVAPSIHRRFNELGHHFGASSPGGHRIFDPVTYVTKTEIDILMENDNTIMAVEVKVDPKIKDIDHHIRCIEILREHRNKLGDKRKIQGAIAGAIFGSAEKKATLEAGFYVLEQSGDTMRLEAPEGFIPREW